MFSPPILWHLSRAMLWQFAPRFSIAWPAAFPSPLSPLTRFTFLSSCFAFLALLFLCPLRKKVLKYAPQSAELAPLFHPPVQKGISFPSRFPLRAPVYILKRGNHTSFVCLLLPAGVTFFSLLFSTPSFPPPPLAPLALLSLMIRM